VNERKQAHEIAKLHVCTHVWTFKPGKIFTKLGMDTVIGSHFSAILLISYN